MNEMISDKLDKEWIKLIKAACEIGLTTDEVRLFIKRQTEGHSKNAIL